MMYVWQQQEWPNFQYDLSNLQSLCTQFAHNRGVLDGLGAAVGRKLAGYQALEAIVDEAVATSLIENELLDREDVRSSIRNQLGMKSKPGSAKSDGIVKMLMDVRHGVKHPVSTDRLLAWHQMALVQDSILSADIVTGAFRQGQDPMTIVSGRIGAEKVHYIAPPADQVPGMMSDLLQWAESDEARSLPAPVTAGIAHLWFEQIHPFEDGNGRVGRALAEHLLNRDSPAGVGPFSLSDTINQDRKTYYAHLQACNKELNIQNYLQWFSQSCVQAQEIAISKFRVVLAKTRYWDQFPELDKEPALAKAINKIFDAGPCGFAHGVSSSKMAALMKTSRSTATRRLAQLVEDGAFVRLAGGGRSTSYMPASEDFLAEMSLRAAPLHQARMLALQEPAGPMSEALTLAFDDLEGIALADLPETEKKVAVALAESIAGMGGKLYRGEYLAEHPLVKKACELKQDVDRAPGPA